MRRLIPGIVPMLLAVALTASITAGFVAFADEADGGCFDNLCGMDSYCSCHRVFTPEYQGQARCYANAQQCEIDLACCARGKRCKGSPRRGDTCTDVVIAAVRKDGGT